MDIKKWEDCIEINIFWYKSFSSGASVCDPAKNISHIQV
jgi:hypothetical protein